MNQVLWFYTGNSCEGDVSNLFGQVKKSYVYCSDIGLQGEKKPTGPNHMKKFVENEAVQKAFKETALSRPCLSEGCGYHSCVKESVTKFD